MSKKWVSTHLVPPPSGVVIMARYGASICFVSHYHPLDRWIHEHNATETVIGPPPEWWCDEVYADNIHKPVPLVENEEQLELEI